MSWLLAVGLGTVVAPWVTSGQTNLASFYSFGIADQFGTNPRHSLIEDASGVFYGTTGNDGAYGKGTVFRLNKNGTGYLVLKQFADDGSTGPSSALTLVSNQVLFGICSWGGPLGGGYVFRLNTNGANFALVHDFSASQGGSYPVGELVQGGDGWLYGVTSSGGNHGGGLVYRLNLQNSEYEVVFHFPADTGNPQSALMLASDGRLYGVVPYGGNNGVGAVYQLDRDASNFIVLHHFSADSSEGVNPECRLLEASDGIIYGTAPYGGSSGQGTVFKIAKDDGSFTVLKHFTGNADGAMPGKGLIEGTDGALYGVCSFGGLGFGNVFKLAKTGAPFTVLRNFNAIGGEPAYLTAPLLKANDNVLYGTAPSGGVGSYSGCCGGVVFRISQTGTSYAITRAFSPSGNDGREAMGRLQMSADGFLYGTTKFGGINDHGIVFKVRPNGSGYSVLRGFRNDGTDAKYPEQGVIEGRDGVLYGTTRSGGSTFGGTVFKINKNGTSYTRIRTFAGGTTDGSYPQSGVIEGQDNYLYGSTSTGGSAGHGILYKLSKSGAFYQVLKHFTGVDGSSPAGSLLQASDGALYGSTVAGGNNQLGVVFRLGTNGAGFTVLQHLQGVPATSSFPSAYDTPPNPGPLLEASDGLLYGVNYQGGNGKGAIYRLNKDGSGYETLRTFLGFDFNDGDTPVDGVTEGGDGRLYGMTFQGGNFGAGTLYRLNRNGSGYEILRHFGDPNANSAGHNPRGLAKGLDGALYGMTWSGGRHNFGMIYLLGQPVQFENHPQNLTSTVGESAAFSVSVSGLPIPALQWRRTELPLPGQTNSSLLLQNVGDELAGNYDLVATNYFGAVTSQVAVLTVNHLPVASSQTVETPEDTAISVLLEASDGDSDPLTFVILSDPSHGQLTGTPPNLTYQPATNYHGTDFFTFKVNDGFVDSSNAVVAVIVHQVNDPPIASADALTTASNAPAVFAAAKLALNDSDADGDSLIVATVSTNSGQNGTVVLASGTVTYTPPSNFTGNDTFTYTLVDGQGGTAVGTVLVTVGPGGAAPLNIVLGPIVEGGDFVVRFSGIPGLTYTIEAAFDLAGPWTKLENLTAPVTNQGWGIGVFEFREPTGHHATRLYRTIYPSY
jgi:uncharacterized repeat protein (TIGR03803 family)